MIRSKALRMQVEDDRTPEQIPTHRWAVVARDKFMSGWGQAKNGVSRCAWAVPDALAGTDLFTALEDWVRSRSEMIHVNVVTLDDYRPRNTAHFHIYVVDADHPCFTRRQSERAHELLGTIAKPVA